MGPFIRRAVEQYMKGTSGSNERFDYDGFIFFSVPLSRTRWFVLVVTVITKELLSVRPQIAAVVPEKTMMLIW
jgi:hypothetical protein